MAASRIDGLPIGGEFNGLDTRSGDRPAVTARPILICLGRGNAVVTDREVLAVWGDVVYRPVRLVENRRWLDSEDANIRILDVRPIVEGCTFRVDRRAAATGTVLAKIATILVLGSLRWASERDVRRPSKSAGELGAR